MISVVIPLYNKELSVGQTINSVLEQTFKDFEVIIVNDGSTDESLQKVKLIEDVRVKILDKTNGGVSSARNMGIRNAKFDYIAFLDADDLWLPNHLSEIHSLITKYKGIAEVFVTNFARKYPNGKIVKNRTDLSEGLIDNYFRRAFRCAVIHTSCICISKKALSTCGGFNENYSYGEDLDLWSRLARKFRIVYSPVITEYYMMESENNASVVKDFKRAASNHILLRESVNFYDFISSLKKLIKIKLLIFKTWLKF